jgi:hypothetical protein
MQTRRVCLPALLFLSILLCTTARGESIRHRFLAVDESRSQLHYVDQFDSSKDWTIQFPGRYRDVQLLGDRVIVSTLTGYEEYDVHTQQKLKAVANPAFSQTETVIRRPNGNTILGCNVPKKQGAGVRFIELDAADHPVREVTFPALHHLRLARIGSDGSILFGCDNEVIMGQWDGTYKTFSIAGEKRHIYEVAELANGTVRVSCGYGVTLEEWTKNGEFVRKLADGKTADGRFCLFFGRAQQLENGHWVVSNWTGHGAQDSQKGPQLLEFDEAGKIVWSWHDATRAGSVHGVIILE